MTVLELSALLNTRGAVRVLDVRTPSEFENAHIPGAYNVPLDLLHEHARELRSARGDVVLVCQSGQRAQRAEALLRDAGMGNMHVVDGGMRAWLGAGLPVNRVRTRVSLERQVRIVAGALAVIGAVGALAVSPLLAIVPAVIGSGLVFSGVTDTCGMAMLLAKLPYNRSAAGCDTAAIVRQFLAR